MRAVKQAPSAPFTSSGYFVALMLVLFSASGLLTGIVMRGFAAALRPTSGASTLAPADMTATANALTPVTATSSFTLQLAVTPNPAKAGQAAQITVTAVGSNATPSATPSATEPVSGLRCALVQTADSLALSPWPDAALTDSAGRAQWGITVPSTASGPYTVSVRCDGAHGYRATRYVTLSVTP